MSLSRRDFLATGGSAIGLGTFGVALPLETALAQGGPIKLGSVLDNSGNLDAYGKPMVMATQLAVEEINAAGGLLGRKVEVVQYDSQSDIALYTKYAQQLVRDDKVDVVHGGITSASREAIRQVFRRADTLYFYNVLYEGGVCDRNCFVTGTTPAQVMEPIVEIATKQWGKKVYVLAADYNYGQITAKWLAHYVKQRGGSVLQTFDGAERGLGRGKALAHALAVGHIERQRDDLSRSLADFGGGFGESALIARGQHDRRAGLREDAGEMPAEPARGAGHQGDASGEVEIRHGAHGRSQPSSGQGRAIVAACISTSSPTWSVRGASSASAGSKRR